MVLDREKTLLDAQTGQVRVQTDLNQINNQLQVALKKIQALEKYSTELQVKCDTLSEKVTDKELQLQELLTSDLASKVVEQKKLIEDLQAMLR